MAIPQDIPICRTVPIMADPVLSFSLGTDPIIELLLGDENIPDPIPCITSLIITSTSLDSVLSRLNRKRAKQIKVIPTVHNILEPTLSDNQPLTGPTIRAVNDMVAKISPVLDAE